MGFQAIKLSFYWLQLNLDNALTRPGLEINLPDVKAREEIFMVHLAPLKVDPNV